MHIRNSILFLTLGAMAAALSAQAPADSPAAPTPASAAPAQAAAAVPAQPAGSATAADLLVPALSNARSTLMALRLEKWKKGSVRDEAEDNVNTLLHDLDNNVQPLIAAADAPPGQLSQAIPLIKHVDALYDVLLRVEEASRVSAPADQIDALQNALLRVSQARIAYDDVLQMQAAGVAKQIADLETAVRAERQNVKDAQHQVELARAAEKTTPCKPATPARRRRRKMAAKKKTEPSPTSQKPAQKPQ